MLGLTATPDRSDEEALGRVFQSAAFEYPILDAIHDGWLVPVEQQMVTIAGLDFSHIKTTAGDLNGKELSERLKALRPDLKVLFISGYTADVIAHRGVLDHGLSFLHKPYSLDELATKVRELLGDSAEPTA